VDSAGSWRTGWPTPSRRLERIHAGDLQITAAFRMSYDHLSPAAQRLCRVWRSCRGPDFAAPLASVLIGSSTLDAEELLDELHELGLLSQIDDVRYGFHDLIGCSPETAWPPRRSRPSGRR